MGEEKNKQSYKDTSKELFSKLAKTCIKTTMVGAIAEIEKEFGEIWGHDGSEMTSEKLENKKKFDMLRKAIFDLGHKQMDLFNKELENYDVVWNRYTLHMKVVNPEDAKLKNE